MYEITYIHTYIPSDDIMIISWSNPRYWSNMMIDILLFVHRLTCIWHVLSSLCPDIYIVQLCAIVVSPLLLLLVIDRSVLEHVFLVYPWWATMEQGPQDRGLKLRSHQWTQVQATYMDILYIYIYIHIYNMNIYLMSAYI